mgnify:CR=1 FL=1
MSKHPSREAWLQAAVQLKVSHCRAASRPRPQASCANCSFQVPKYRKFLSYGPALCPKDKNEMTPVGDWEEI